MGINRHLPRVLYDMPEFQIENDSLQHAQN